MLYAHGVQQHSDLGRGPPGVLDAGCIGDGRLQLVESSSPIRVAAQSDEDPPAVEKSVHGDGAVRLHRLLPGAVEFLLESDGRAEVEGVHSDPQSLLGQRRHGKQRLVVGLLAQESSSRWAGPITKATHDQWALARRGQLAYIQSLEAGVRMIAYRLSLPIGQKGGKRTPGGYRSRAEWHAKARRLRVLEDRLQAARADWEAGVVRVVRGGKGLLNTRHHLWAAGLTEERWRTRWQAVRRFLEADGESGKRFGNETIRVTPEGEVWIKLPSPLAHLANAPHGRYVLAARVAFAHRGEQWRDRVTAALRAFLRAAKAGEFDRLGG